MRKYRLICEIRHDQLNTVTSVLANEVTNLRIEELTPGVPLNGKHGPRRGGPSEWKSRVAAQPWMQELAPKVLGMMERGKQYHYKCPEFGKLLVESGRLPTGVSSVLSVLRSQHKVELVGRGTYVKV